MKSLNNYTKRKSHESSLMSLGLNFVSGVVLYFFLGYYLDDYLNHQFTFKIIGLFLGLFGSTYKLIKDVKKIDGVQKNQD